MSKKAPTEKELEQFRVDYSNAKQIPIGLLFGKSADEVNLDDLPAAKGLIEAMQQLSKIIQQSE